MNMSVIGWIMVGLAAGVIAKYLLGSRAKHGVVITILIGIAGALIGGWAATEIFGITATGGFSDVSTWLAAIAGSVVLLGIYHAITTTNTSRRASRLSDNWRARR